MTTESDLTTMLQQLLINQDEMKRQFEARFDALEQHSRSPSRSRAHSPEASPALTTNSSNDISKQAHELVQDDVKALLSDKCSVTLSIDNYKAYVKSKLDEVYSTHCGPVTNLDLPSIQSQLATRAGTMTRDSSQAYHLHSHQGRHHSHSNQASSPAHQPDNRPPCATCGQQHGPICFYENPEKAPPHCQAHFQGAHTVLQHQHQQPAALASTSPPVNDLSHSHELVPFEDPNAVAKAFAAQLTPPSVFTA